MKHNRILVLTCVIIVAMVIPILLLQMIDRQSVLADTENASWGDPQVGFIVNTTSGMQPEINQTNAAWGQVGAYWNCLTCTYHLTQFRDNAMYIGKTQNETQFGNWLGNLNAAGGGECSDNTYAGLREFVLNLPDDAPVSDAIVFSDSPPTGNRRTFGFVLDKMIENNVRVHNVGRALCNNENLPYYAMDYFALLTGGEFHRPVSAGEYMTDTLIAMNLAMSKDLFGTYMGHLDNSVNVYPLDIDSSITTLGVDHHWWCLTCTRSAENGLPPSDIGDIKMELVDPDGNVVDENTPGFRSLTTAMRDMQIMFETLTHDDTGQWQLRIIGSGEYAVNVFGNSTVHMKSIGRNVARANKEFEVRALITAEEDNELSSRCHDVPCEPLTATLKLIGVDTFESIDVDMFNIGMPPSVFGGAVTVPNPGLYRLVAEGTLLDGSKFMRVDPTPIRIRTHNMDGSDDAPALPGSTRAVSFELVNDGAAGRSTATTFDLELFSELGWTTADMIPDSVTLDPGQSVQYTVEVVIPADADAGLIEDSTLVAVPQDDLGATISSSSQTLVVDQLSSFLPLILK